MINPSPVPNPPTLFTLPLCLGHRLRRDAAHLARRAVRCLPPRAPTRTCALCSRRRPHAAAVRCLPPRRLSHTCLARRRARSNHARRLRRPLRTPPDYGGRRRAATEATQTLANLPLTLSNPHPNPNPNRKPNPNPLSEPSRTSSRIPVLSNTLTRCASAEAEAWQGLEASTEARPCSGVLQR